jgi:hypothetical protein
MYSKRIVTLALLVVWAAFGYFSQLGPLGRMPLFVWLFFGVLMYGLFAFLDALKAKLPAKAPEKPRERPPASKLELVIRLGLSVYLWIPLLLLIYFLFHTYDPAKVSGRLLAHLQIIINMLLLMLCRNFLVKRYCENKQTDTADNTRRP